MTREEAIQALKDLRDIRLQGVEWTESLDMAIESLSADTVSRSQYQGLLNAIGKVYVEVVRCKDCRKGDTTDEDELVFCQVFQKWFAETFYCADGKRREE